MTGECSAAIMVTARQLAALLACAACAKKPADPGRSEPASTAEPPTPAPSAVAAAPASRRCEAVRCLSIEACDEATGQCVPRCPAGEVYIPPTGPEGFVMGKGFTTHGTSRVVGKGHKADSDRPHRVVLTKPFCMDEAEVTVAAFRSCVDAGACPAPKVFEVFANYPKKPDHPVNEVAWPKAKKYCEAQGKNLPTEAQWEWAATGGDGRKWPWGDEEPTCEHADFTIGLLVSPGGDSGCHGGGTSPVKTHPKGNKTWPSGALYDLAGNVWEWCEDSYAPYREEDATDPLVIDPHSLNHVVRGGGWNRSNRGIQTSFRGAAIQTYEVPGLGFRCVRNPTHP
jgi:formylglycine-generating enzyme required for sulfatase activity